MRNFCPKCKIVVHEFETSQNVYSMKLHHGACGTELVDQDIVVANKPIDLRSKMTDTSAPVVRFVAPPSPEEKRKAKKDSELKELILTRLRELIESVEKDEVKHVSFIGLGDEVMYEFWQTQHISKRDERAFLGLLKGQADHFSRLTMECDHE